MGETCWWLGFGLYAVSVGQWYMLCGWALNTAVLIQVTFMTEGRMSCNRTGDKLAVWEEYKRCTACWLPLSHGVAALGGLRPTGKYWTKLDNKGCGSRVILDKQIEDYMVTGSIGIDISIQDNAPEV